MNTIGGYIHLNQPNLHGHRVAVGRVGHKWTTVAMFVDGGRVALRRFKGEQVIKPIGDETPRSLARRILKRKPPMTKGARALLKEVAA